MPATSTGVAPVASLTAALRQEQMPNTVVSFVTGDIPMSLIGVSREDARSLSLSPTYRPTFKSGGAADTFERIDCTGG